MMLAAGSAGAQAADDSFFQDLDRAEAVTSTAQLGATSIVPAELKGPTQVAKPLAPSVPARPAVSPRARATCRCIAREELAMGGRVQ